MIDRIVAAVSVHVERLGIAGRNGGVVETYDCTSTVASEPTDNISCG